MAYKNIHDCFWTDSKVRKLGKDEKLLLLYLITSPHSHYTGVYYLPKELMRLEAGVDPDKSLTALINKEFVRYDEENLIIWVVNMAKYQMNGKSKQLIQGAIRHVEATESPLAEEFMMYYKELLDTL